MTTNSPSLNIAGISSEVPVPGPLDAPPRRMSKSLIPPSDLLSRNALAVGAPDEPGDLIFSPLPSAIRFLLACMLAHKPSLAWIRPPRAAIGLSISNC